MPEYGHNKVCLSYLYVKGVLACYFRLTIAFFAISGLDVLGAIEELSEEKRRNLIDWIYSLQVVNEDGKNVF